VTDDCCPECAIEQLQNKVYASDEISNFGKAALKKHSTRMREIARSSATLPKRVAQVEAADSELWNAVGRVGKMEQDERDAQEAKRSGEKPAGEQLDQVKPDVEQLDQVKPDVEQLDQVKPDVEQLDQVKPDVEQLDQVKPAKIHSDGKKHKPRR